MLLAMNTGSVTPASALTAGQAAALLSCSKVTIIKLLKQGNFPGAYRVGAHWRIPVADLEAYREANTFRLETAGGGA